MFCYVWVMLAEILVIAFSFFGNPLDSLGSPKIGWWGSLKRQLSTLTSTWLPSQTGRMARLDLLIVER
jgi:hypothetical protein